MKYINTPYSIVIVLLLTVLYTNCKSEPIDLDDPKNYPLKYTNGSFDHTAKPHLYLITSDKGDYKTIDEAPAYKKCIENYYLENTDWGKDLKERIIYKSIVLDTDSTLTIEESDNLTEHSKYIIETNKNIRLLTPSYWVPMNISEDGKRITHYLQGYFLKRNGRNYPIDYAIHFTHDNGYGNINESIANAIFGSQLKTNDTLFIGLMETKYSLK